MPRWSNFIAVVHSFVDVNCDNFYSHFQKIVNIPEKFANTPTFLFDKKQKRANSLHDQLCEHSRMSYLRLFFDKSLKLSFFVYFILCPVLGNNFMYFSLMILLILCRFLRISCVIHVKLFS